VSAAVRRFLAELRAVALLSPILCPFALRPDPRSETGRCPLGAALDTAFELSRGERAESELTQKPSFVVLPGSSPPQHYTGPMRLTATGTFSHDTTLGVTSQVSWKSSAKKRVSVKTGLVRAIKTGPPVTVTASKGHKGPSGSATVTVN